VAQQLGHLGIRNPVGKGIGGKPVAETVGSDPPQPEPPPGLENPVAEAVGAERLSLAVAEEGAGRVTLGQGLAQLHHGRGQVDNSHLARAVRFVFVKEPGSRPNIKMTGRHLAQLTRPAASPVQGQEGILDVGRSHGQEPGMVLWCNEGVGPPRKGAGEFQAGGRV
jgi:hypothetical protein